MTAAAVAPAWLAALEPAPGLPAWARAAGVDASVALRGRGLPGRREEAWRYTRLEALRRAELHRAEPPAAVDTAALPDALGPRLVFAAGYLVPGLCTLADLPAGVTVQPLRALEDPQRLPGGVASEDEFVRALHRAARTDGALIEVTEDATDAVLEVVYLGPPAQALAAPYLGIRMAPGARLRLIEQHTPSGAGLEALRQVVHLAEGARLEHVRILAAGAAGQVLAASDLTLDAGAEYRAWRLAGGGALVREDLRIALAGAGAQAQCAILHAAAGAEQTDVHVCVEHGAPATRSRVRAHGVAAGRGRAVLGGRVHVHHGADGTDARLDTANLLLSAQAEVDAKPELEIYADDVQCAHGATVGSLDADQLYYLASRGIAPHEGQILLVGAFARAVLQGVADELGAPRLEAALADRVRALAAQEDA